MATILIIDDEENITSVLGAFFQRGGHHVIQAHRGADGVEWYHRAQPDLTLLDVRLPDMSGFEVLEQIRTNHPVVIMMTGEADVPLAVRAMQEGAENFLMKPVELAHLAGASDRALEKSRLRRLNRYLAERRADGFDGLLLGNSPSMKELAEQIDLVARSDRTTVLLLGESGSGKGRIAAAIHSGSPRASQPFVEVNCAALTEESLDRELFGEERTVGGEILDRKPGLFDVADSGTLFLDEIGDLSPTLQPKLLRVLEGKSFRRLGGTQEITVDVRLIAATSKDLVNEVTAERFREDLYYRLSVMPITLPPLRARSREDLVELMGRLQEELRPQLVDAPETIGEAALDRLLRYSWPGNIRELRNVLERAMIMGRGSRHILPEHLAGEVREASGADVGHHVPKSLAEVERIHIERTLRAHDSNRTRAARELGISRATLIKKIKEYGLNARVR